MKNALVRVLFWLLRRLGVIIHQSFNVPPPADPSWERVRLRLVNGEIPYIRHKLSVYGIDIQGRAVTLRCVDAEEKGFLADVQVDAQLLDQLTRILDLAIHRKEEDTSENPLQP